MQDTSPLETLRECKGKEIWVIMKNEREFIGTLCGFDDFTNMVLHNVTEYEMTPEGKMKPNKIDSLMLNGNNICMISTDPHLKQVD